MFPDLSKVKDKEAIRRSLERHLLQSTGMEPEAAQAQHWLGATIGLARELVSERWAEARRKKERQGAKEACYFSMEFLVGRLLTDTLRNLGAYDVCAEMLTRVGYNIEDIAELEVDPGLGNGGLGRLAACLLDSTAAIGIPAYGYGLRYEFGMFAQRIKEGWQSEEPEQWLRFGGRWEFARSDLTYPVRYHGRLAESGRDGATAPGQWIECATVLATAFDIPAAGYSSDTVNTLRLWSARATHELDLERFNAGDHLGAVLDKAQWESLTRVLYPHDGTAAGRELRFKQQYFLVSASLQDIIARLKRQGCSLDMLPSRIAVQINDTHPAMAVAELMRLLVDENGLTWDHAWDITRRVISYTNHTLMPEALERWPLRFFEIILPRHLQIIYRINDSFLKEVAARYPGDIDLLRRVSFIDEDGERHVRMANLAFVGSHRINGVSKIHTELMKRTVFADLDRLLPGRIINITNGVASRRWLAGANPDLRNLISSKIGNGWMRDLSELKQLLPFVEDAAFRADFRSAKAANKQRLANHIEAETGLSVSVTSIFDAQIKRIHEYKRQLLKLLHAVALYNRIRNNPGGDHTARTVIFAGKAAPGYAMAKLIIKLINDVARVVNHDPLIGDRLKILFLPNYSVSLAERIVPAVDLSEQISTAGTEASGTGNMKMAMNGALTVGTLDGANIEIRDAVGAENFFAFGLTTDEVAYLEKGHYDALSYLRRDNDLQQALEMIGNGFFSPSNRDLFQPIVQSLTRGGDRFFVLADFTYYVGIQAEIEACYADQEEWTRRAIINTANMGMFSSDRAVVDYAREIWQTRPLAD
ncbi:glycogen/starch/alpha-glucan phosphorylase [Dongia soli]|uniref:Alpha-1,4 glucan phosphorylase n=1 Tax=Dongia soli TaxID=600628 RepID=A0ABU5E6X8_9PROT|nr:glycogen/starch/alpha-glucan phosphorylase [Dongia soli]MDY0881632.1 glycogen/starch/alpha-glucan phosphorylase [Dongia soli]